VDRQWQRESTRNRQKDYQRVSNDDQETDDQARCRVSLSEVSTMPTQPCKFSGRAQNSCSWAPAVKWNSDRRRRRYGSPVPISAQWRLYHAGRKRQRAFDQGLSRFHMAHDSAHGGHGALVFFINGFTKHDWKGAFFFAWLWP